MKNLLFKLHKHKQLNNRLIIFLICIFIALLFIYGENYALWGSVYPDEIMDLPFPFFPFHPEAENIVCSESMDDKQFVSSAEIQTFSIYKLYLAKASSLFVEFKYLKDFEKRFSILQRYNS